MLIVGAGVGLTIMLKTFAGPLQLPNVGTTEILAVIGEPVELVAIKDGIPAVPLVDSNPILG